MPRCGPALERAVQLAPGYADAWGMLSLLYAEEFSNGFNARPDPLGRALQAARRAADAAPSSALAYNALARALFFRKEFQAFRIAADRAIELNPLNGPTLAGLGGMIAYAGDWEHGCAQVERAARLNPRHPGRVLVSVVLQCVSPGRLPRRAERRAQDQPAGFLRDPRGPGRRLRPARGTRRGRQEPAGTAQAASRTSSRRCARNWASGSIRTWSSTRSTGSARRGSRLHQSPGHASRLEAARAGHHHPFRRRRAPRHRGPAVHQQQSGPRQRLLQRRPHRGDHHRPGAHQGAAGHLAHLGDATEGHRTRTCARSAASSASATCSKGASAGPATRSGSRPSSSTPRNDAQLWAEKYNGTMDDVFDVQERVSRAIVDALNVTLSSDEDRHLADRPIQDVRAFELFLQARQEIRRYNLERGVAAAPAGHRDRGRSPRPSGPCGPGRSSRRCGRG